MRACPKHRVVLLLISILSGVGLLWMSMITLRAVVAAQTGPGDSSRLSRGPVVSATSSGCVPEFPLTLVAYQAWFGLDSHVKPPPYVSTGTTVISGQITAALARGIDGFVVDWYGPQAGVVNDEDRGFIDQATAELLRQSGERGFHVALMYDEGTVSTAETVTAAYTTRVISDLLYARRYFTMPGYLRINGCMNEHPALFVFPYDAVAPYVDWPQVRNQLGITVTLLDEDPNPGDPAHDAQFDGFYAWVQPTGGQWSADGTEWGEGYLRWFYDTMTTPAYSDKVTIGGVWPGFDDSLAPWGGGRYISRRCGQTWRDTWDIAAQYNPSIVMITTWNDFEEDTGVEYGVGGPCAYLPLVMGHAPGTITGEYRLTANPCTTDPCLPGLVYAVQAGSAYYHLTVDGAWLWENRSWDGYTPQEGDLVTVTGYVSEGMDVLGDSFYNIEVVALQPAQPADATSPLPQAPSQACKPGLQAPCEAGGGP